MIQHIGQDFSTGIKVNLFPGIYIPRGPYYIHIQFVTDIGGLMTMHHITMQSDQMIDVFIGRDVRELSVILETNLVWSGPHLNLHYSMRVDQLILLNLAVKLLKT